MIETRSYALKKAENIGTKLDLSSLNHEQSAVVNAALQPVFVLAGAGSGKTRALTYRIARMIERGLRPSSIVALTFTNKAAAEMRKRVVDLLGSSAEDLLCGTFHSIAHRFLRNHAESLNLSRQFSVLDRDDAKQMMSNVMAETATKNELAQLPKSERMLKIISLTINTQKHVADILAAQAPRFYIYRDLIAKICSAFLERKIQQNCMDFDDLLIHFYRLLESEDPVIQEHLTRLSAVLVDEYQDTNALQALIVHRLAREHQNITVVGDDAQSIYAFRGAHIENMYAFTEHYPNAISFRLEHNYRSTPQIIALANTVLLDIHRGLPKQLKAMNKDGIYPVLACAEDPFTQASFITQRIIELQTEGRTLKEIAVLYRAHAHSLEIQVALSKAGIPYQIRSGVRFFEQAHIKDILSFLRLLANPLDEISFTRSLQLFAGLGSKSIMQCWRVHQQLHQEDSNIWATDQKVSDLPTRVLRCLQPWQSLMQKIASQSEHVHQIIDTILDDPKLAYTDHLQKRYENHRDRVQEILQLADFATRFQTLELFLSELSLNDVVGVHTEKNNDRDQDHITLSSIHQAKGLEWPVVFVPWLVDGKFPSEFALDNPDGEDEERRLFYVAITRAQEELYLSYPIMLRAKDWTQMICRPSRFIAFESIENFCERWELSWSHEESNDEKQQLSS